MRRRLERCLSSPGLGPSRGRRAQLRRARSKARKPSLHPRRLSPRTRPSFRSSRSSWRPASGRGRSKPTTSPPRSGPTAFSTPPSTLACCACFKARTRRAHSTLSGSSFVSISDAPTASSPARSSGGSSLRTRWSRPRCTIWCLPASCAPRGSSKAALSLMAQGRAKFLPPKAFRSETQSSRRERGECRS